MRTSESVKEIFGALVKAQAVMETAKKTSDNPFHKNKYADLAEVMETAKKPLADNGLAMVQEATVAEGRVQITTRLIHTSGEWMEFGPLQIQPAKPDAQSTVAAVTYGRRCTAQAALGMAAEDDDGNEASGLKEGHGGGQQRQQDRIAKVAAKAVTGAPAVVAVHGTPPSASAPLPAFEEVKIDWGKNEGKPVSALSVSQLEWYIESCIDTLVQQKFASQWKSKQRLLDALNVEYVKRTGSAYITNDEKKAGES